MTFHLHENVIDTATICIDYKNRSRYKHGVSLDEGPCSRGDPEDGAGSGVLRPRLVTADSGGPGKPPAGHYDPAANLSLELRRKCRSMSMRLPEQKAPGWSAGEAPAPLQLRGMRRLVTGARADLASPPGRLRRGARRLSRRSMSLAHPRGRRKQGKGDARRPKMQVAGRRSVGYGLFDK